MHLTLQAAMQADSKTPRPKGTNQGLCMFEPIYNKSHLFIITENQTTANCVEEPVLRLSLQAVAVFCSFCFLATQDLSSHDLNS